MARDYRESEESMEEDDGNWLNSYSDMMTDLLAIFVILFSFAMMNSKGMKSASSAAEATENVVVASEGQAINGGDGLLPAKNGIIESINKYIKEEDLSDQLNVMEQGEDSVLLRVKDSALFESGRADINKKSARLLGNISSILTEYKDQIKMVRIEGHTDNRPMHSRQFQSNWELSTSRAVNVLKHLAESSPIEPAKFSAVGYCEFHPIADNRTEAGKAKNRRVDFIIETMSDTKKPDTKK